MVQKKDQSLENYKTVSPLRVSKGATDDEHFQRLS